jgi:NAD+ synthase (glutamine-hydrolysing)
VADVDIEHLLLGREHVTSFGDSVHALPPGPPWRFVEMELPAWTGSPFRRVVDPAPFIPRDDHERNRRTEEIFAIQAAGLVKRMSQSGITRLLLGLSGGSTPRSPCWSLCPVHTHSRASSSPGNGACSWLCSCRTCSH